MRIRIDFAEINQHFFESDIMDEPNFSEILVNYIQDNYFNGADNAVIYLGNNHDMEYVEIDILPG